MIMLLSIVASFAKVEITRALKLDDGAALCSATHLYVRPSSGGSAAEYSVAAANSACAHLVDSVHEAQAALRGGLGAGGPRFVNLLSGDHQLSSPLRLGSADSGSVDAPIVWRSAPGHRARLTAGVRVPVTAFAPVSVPSGAAGVLQADLTLLGFNSSEMGNMADPHPINLAELFVGGVPATLARAPNRVGTYYGFENLTNTSAQGFALADEAANSLLRAVLSRDRAVVMHGYWMYDWMDTYLRIVGITPNSQGAVYTRDPSTPPQLPFTSGCRFYAVDSLMLLDSPGEYFINRSSARLYYLPVEPMTSATDIVVSRLEVVVEVVVFW